MFTFDQQSTIGPNGRVAAPLRSSTDLRKFTYKHPLAIAKVDPKSQNLSRPFTWMWEGPEFFFLDGKPVLFVARGEQVSDGNLF